MIGDDQINFVMRTTHEIDQKATISILPKVKDISESIRNEANSSGTFFSST